MAQRGMVRHDTAMLLLLFLGTTENSKLHDNTVPRERGVRRAGRTQISPFSYGATDTDTDAGKCMLCLFLGVGPTLPMSACCVFS